VPNISTPTHAALRCEDRVEVRHGDLRDTSHTHTDIYTPQAHKSSSMNHKLYPASRRPRMLPSGARTAWRCGTGTFETFPRPCQRGPPSTSSQVSKGRVCERSLACLPYSHTCLHGGLLYTSALTTAAWLIRCASIRPEQNEHSQHHTT
jgi:hypothetical protein